jgi:hypothetical protein
VAQGEGVLQRAEEGTDAGPGVIRFDTDATAAGDPEPPPASDPHAVRAVDPAHGSFAGGQIALVRGAGFTSEVRIWFGESEVVASQVIPIDPTRAQVTVPSGASGAIDVTAQNGDDASTRRTLSNGYVYDAFTVAPSRGPVAGGTVITLTGDQGSWDETTQVFVDLKPCEVLAVRDVSDGLQEIDCRTPEGTAGAKPVRVQTGSATADVLDAFVYGDSDNGFTSGLSGAILGDHLSVIVLGDDDGRAIPGATIVVSSGSGESREITGQTGVATFTGGPFGPKATVTAVAHCRMPVTFVDVPVDQITFYLDRVLSPECLPEGDPPGVGGSPQSSARIEGEIVFPGGVEFQRGDWNVPFAQSGSRRRAAYLFELSNNPRRLFRLPSASQAITVDADGTLGYEFSYQGGLGSLTLYALAGVENREVDPPLFTAYAMGLVRGVLAEPGQTTSEVFVRIDNPLDHAVSVDITGPTPTSRGPDRVETNIAVRVGTLGYAILPLGVQERLLPTTDPIRLVGLPPLVGSLLGSDYVLSAIADTGFSGSPPMSVVGLYSLPPASTTVSVDGFVQIPQLVSPTTNGAWDGRHLVVSAPPGGPPADLTLVQVNAGNGLWSWTIAAPGHATELELPDPATLPDLGLSRGAVTLEVNRARIGGFDYGALRFSSLTARGWDAYATDTLQAHYE